VSLTTACNKTWYFTTKWCLPLLRKLTVTAAWCWPIKIFPTFRVASLHSKLNGFLIILAKGGPLMEIADWHGPGNAAIAFSAGSLIFQKELKGLRNILAKFSRWLLTWAQTFSAKRIGAAQKMMHHFVNQGSVTTQFDS